MFGAKNKLGLYVPMSPTEMETLQRLWETKSYSLQEDQWGEFTIIDVIVGDKRLGVIFEIGPKCFESVETPVPLYILNLKLQALGRTLFVKKMLVSNEGQPLYVCKGVTFGLQLDIAIDQINPDLIKEVLPKVQGLTSRLGNTRYTSQEKRLLKEIERGNNLLRSLDQQNLAKVNSRET